MSLRKAVNFIKKKEYISQNVEFKNNIIAVEGNIGCGKSTLLTSLSHQGFITIPEPVGNETNTAQWDTYLNLLYANPKRWTFLFQIEVLNWFHSINQEQLVIANQQKKQKFIIIERSSSTSIEIFTQRAVENGNLTDLEFNTLKQLFHRDVKWQAKHVLYLQTPPEVCKQRHKERNRQCETQMSTKDANDLFKDLHHRHETQFGNINSQQKQIIHILAANL